jgi:hypothetical protein
LEGVHSRDELIEKTVGAPKVKANPIPKRKGGDGEKPGDDRPSEQPQPPTPKPPHPMQPKTPIPKHVQELIVERSGYTNYYFNQLNRTRVWDAFATHGSFADVGGAWRLTGVDDGDGAVVIELNDQKVSGQFPGQSAEVDPSRDLAGQLGPAGSGGLLVALHVWQRMLRQGPQQFGEVFYQGTAPIIHRDGLYDVLVATYDVVESRFMFAPDSGLLVALELFTDENIDPCEVYFGDYRAVDGRQVPHALVVRHGDRVFTSIKLESVQFAAPAAVDDAS